MDMDLSFTAAMPRPGLLLYSYRIVLHAK